MKKQCPECDRQVVVDATDDRESVSIHYAAMMNGVHHIVGTTRDGEFCCGFCNREIQLGHKEKRKKVEKDKGGEHESV